MAQDNRVTGNPAGTGPGPGPTASSSNVLSIISFVLAAIAVFFLPIVFGPIAIVLAIIALVRKERLGKIALIVAIAATILGFVLGAVVQSAMA